MNIAFFVLELLFLACTYTLAENLNKNNLIILNMIDFVMFATLFGCLFLTYKYLRSVNVHFRIPN